MAKHLFAVLLALASVSLQPRLASATACASTPSVEVRLEPASDCLKIITDKPACDGMSMVTITNGCTSDLIGIERRSSVQVIPKGQPPLQACIDAQREATDKGNAPPRCVLAQGQSGKIFAWGGDVLELELDGKKLVASVENIEDDAPGVGCSTSGRNKGELGALLIALGALLVGRRRRPMKR